MQNEPLFNQKTPLRSQMVYRQLVFEGSMLYSLLGKFGLNSLNAFLNFLFKSFQNKLLMIALYVLYLNIIVLYRTFSLLVLLPNSNKAAGSPPASCAVCMFYLCTFVFSLVVSHRPKTCRLGLLVTQICPLLLVTV